MHLNKSYQCRAWLHCPRHGHYAVRGEGGKGRGKWQLVLKRRHRDHRGGGGGGWFGGTRVWRITRVDENESKALFRLLFLSAVAPGSWYPFDGLNFFFFFSTTATPHFPSGWRLPSCARSRRGISSEKLQGRSWP